MAAKKTKKKTVKKTTKKSAKKPVKKVSKKVSKKVPKKVPKKALKKSTKKITKKVAKKSAKKKLVPKRVAKKSVKKTTKKTAKKVVRKVVKKSSSSKVVKAPIVKKIFSTITYLSNRELNHFRKVLTEEKNQILENAKRLRDSLVDENTGEYVGDNSTFSMHMAEQGTDEMEREKAYMFIQRDEKYLGYLQEALDRIENKTYGRCVTCGRPIPKLRLEVVPITQHCLNCKQAKSS